ncbi:MAG: 23S rRNA (adenine(2503)-C(2))-methyltransferase RlmN [Desulfobulbaceae bacterium]|nr:23S rRNA (adenine(2503)-C(2))-methyltransferase RlmN [Desulfobulbaceae bacterium]
MKAKTDLRDLTYSELAAYMEGLGLPSSRARFVFAWLQRPGTRDFSQMVDVKREIRATLAEHAVISSLVPAAVEQSQDGAVKFAFALDNGVVVESVLIPEKGRHTLCVSSQAGCAMGCRFCLTGGMGFRRNLRPAEIVGQVIAVLEYMINAGVVRTTLRELINNLVFMGMGEPLANYDNLIAALRILMDERGLEFTERRITVSTCGIVPRIRDLGHDIRVNLAVSLHAADDETRSRLMPVNKAYGLDDLLAACRSFPLPGKKVILFEYILIKGINDSADDARKLAEKLHGLPCRINLLPYNATQSLHYECPDEEHILQFQKILRDAGYRTFIRSSRGADISAACGQLASTGKRDEQT